MKTWLTQNIEHSRHTPDNHFEVFGAALLGLLAHKTV